MKVSWGDDIPNIYGKIKFMFQTTNQILNRDLNLWSSRSLILSHTHVNDVGVFSAREWLSLGGLVKFPSEGALLAD